MGVLHLFMVYSSLVQELKLPALSRKMPIVAYVFSRRKLKLLIDSIGLYEASHAFLELLPVDIAQSQHV